MKIEQNSVVLFHYRLLDEQKNEIANSRERDEPLPYIHGHKNIVEGLEDEMLGREAGDTFVATLPPEKTYGDHNPDLIEVIERASFDPSAEIAVGMHFQVQDNEGNERIALITDVNETDVTVDTNHPLSGKELTFDAEIISVRAATAEEIAAGQIEIS